MSALAPRTALAPLDRRQSEAAAAIARGTGRLLAALGRAVVAELPLASGRRADLVALAGDGEVWIVEIKSCLADFRADHKWQDYRLHCDRLFFAVSLEFPCAVLPEEAGLILADAHGAVIERDAPEHRLPAATRKAMLLRFAHAAAGRLHGLLDPGLRLPDGA